MISNLLLDKLLRDQCVLVPKLKSLRKKIKIPLFKNARRTLMDEKTNFFAFGTLKSKKKMMDNSYDPVFG